MKDNEKPNRDLLRQNAEERLKIQVAKAKDLFATGPDTLKLIHELEVHQVELELQNEELLLAKKRAELAAEKYTNLYDFAPLGYFTLSADGKIRELNLAGVRMLGKERLYLQKASFIFFVSGDSRPVFNRFLEEAFKSTHSVTCEVSLITEGNIPLAVKLLGIRDETGNHCLMTAIDITERKITEARLQKDKERNDLLLELFTQAPVLTDKELYDRALDIAVKLTDSKIGFFHQVSDNQQEIILTTWNDEAKKNCTTISDNHYPLKAAGNWADCVRQKKAVVYNNFQQSPNKKGLPEGHAPVGRFMSIPVVQDDKVRFIFGVGNKASDYTDLDVVQIQSVAGELHKILEKRKIEQSLRKIEDRWQFAFEGSNDGVWDWNVLTGEAFFSNRWKEMIGYGPHELEGKLSEWKDRVHADDLPAVMESLHRHFNGESPQYVTEHRIRCKDGSWKWITDRGKVLEWTPEGKSARMLGTHTDITERKLVEDTQTFLLGCGLPGTGEDFFESLACYLAETLNMEYVCIDRLEGDGLTAQTVAIYNEGRLESNVQYALRDTPCGEVAEKHVCCHANGVQRLFPNDAALQELNAESYVGTTLIDSNGQSNGLIAIIGHHPLVETRRAESLLKLVAQRAAGEMERLKIETQRRQAESKLKESEVKYRQLADNSPSIIYRLILKPELRFDYVSPSATEITGYTPEDHYSDPQLGIKLVHPDDRKLLEDTARYSNGEPLVLRWIKKDGAIIWTEQRNVLLFDKNNEPFAIEGQARDITESRIAEETIRKSEEKFRIVADNAFNWEFWEGAYGQWIHHSMSCKKLTGYSAEEFMNDNELLLKIIHPDDLQAYLVHQQQARTYQAPGSQYFRIITKEGEIRDIEHVCQPVYNNAGSFIGIRGSNIDITERKRAEEDLIQAKLHAEESDRLKSAFLSNMSHEIRTPMNGILGFAELLKTPGLSGDQQQEYIAIIRKGGNRMLNIINDIVDISKIEAGLMKPDIKESNINEQVEYTYTFFKPEVEAKGIKFSFKNTLPANEATITTDREKVFSILANLIKNAIKYTSTGSIEFGYYKKLGYLEFYIKDTGIGIPKDRQEAIFERFIQADIDDKMARQGAGLGLSISKSFVEMLGGKIWVESEVEIGSAFYFTLPYNAESVKETLDQQLEPSVKIDIVKKLKILIAEDDDVSEMLITINVKEFGKEILKARTGVEAVEACRENPDIDLILMDILMPEMGGHEATRQIRRFNKDVVIIAQTAYGLTGDKEKAIEAGCNDYIAKPIRKEVLLALIQKYFKK